MAEHIVIDVTEATFQSEVLERSRSVPVLVDFWASWCGPCRMLTPVLETVARGMGGAFVLAKVNTEESPALSYELGIQGIPAVKMFRDGRVVGEFVGYRPEAEVRAFVGAYLPSESDGLAEKAEELAGAGKPSEAAALYEQALEGDPRNAAALLGLARLRAKQGDFEEAERLYTRVATGGPEEAEAERGLSRIRLLKLAKELGDPAAAGQRAADTPADAEARYAHGVHLAASERYEEAMDELLRAVASSRTREQAREAMTHVFSILGQDSEIVREYRAKLARALF